MPELPEVETLRRQLEKEIVGRRISKINIIFSGRINVPADIFVAQLQGAKFIKISRRAKLLRIHLDNDYSLLVHLKMSGRFLWTKVGTIPTKHTHIIFVCDNGYELHFEDIRKFGYIHLCSNDEAETIFQTKYGIEPLDDALTAKKFAAIFRKKESGKIKPLLLNQELVAGVGNIYADEACHVAHVHPARPANSISDEEFKKLHKALRQALTDSIKRRGTSADKYFDLYGTKGDNVHFLKVYGREGGDCEQCGATIEKIRLAGRGTHYCPKCQTL